jgi:hypothetical protein
MLWPVQFADSKLSQKWSHKYLCRAVRKVGGNLNLILDKCVSPNNGRALYQMLLYTVRRIAKRSRENGNVKQGHHLEETTNTSKYLFTT